MERKYTKEEEKQLWKEYFKKKGWDKEDKAFRDKLETINNVVIGLAIYDVLRYFLLLFKQ